MVTHEVDVLAVFIKLLLSLRLKQMSIFILFLIVVSLGLFGAIVK
jgi:hypothetical protein